MAKSVPATRAMTCMASSARVTLRKHGSFSPFTPSSFLAQALSLMVKAVSEDTLKTVSPTLKGKGAGMATRVFSFTHLTWPVPAKSSLTVKARPAMSVFGCTLTRSPTWRRSRVSKLIRLARISLISPR